MGKCDLIALSADMAELADAPDLGSGGRPCRFDSCYPHDSYKKCTSVHIKNRSMLAWNRFFICADVYGDSRGTSVAGAALVCTSCS